MGIRKSVFRLTSNERNNFLAAVLTLKNTIANPGDPPAQQISIYDQFAAIHLCVLSVNQPGAGSPVNVGHQNSGFGPWHRYFLLRFEQALQAVDPSVMLPYWDWTDHSGTDMVLFQDDFIGPNGGAGGSGGGTVQSGYFAFNAPALLPPWWPAGLAGWRIRPELAMANGTTLRRFLDPFANLATASHVDTTMAKPTYEGGAGNSFRQALEAGSRMHNAGHGWVGGHMSDPTASPNDPVFFLHHANVDRLWAMWQIDNHGGPGFYPAAGRPVGHNLNDPMWPWVGAMGGFGSNNLPSGIVLPDFSADPVITPADMLDHRGLGYAYDTEAVVGVALDQTGSMDGDTPDPMTGLGTVSKWEAAKQGVSAMLQDAEAAYSAREAYVIGGVQTFRSVFPSGNVFTKLSGGTPSGIVKSGAPHGSAAFDAAVAAESPGGGTPLADTLVNTENDLVRAPFGDQPAGEQRYLVMLTDGISTAGTPLSALAEPEFPDSIIFAMGFGVGGGWDGVDYATIANIVAKGKGAPAGVQQVFHGENAGEIDKFFTNAIAAAIGYVPTTDPVYELFPGEYIPTDFYATDADHAFMITGQGYNFSDRDWHFALRAPDGRIKAHTFSMTPPADPDPFRITLRKKRGRGTLFLNRNGAPSDAWVGKWQLIAFYRSTPESDLMLMPALSDQLLSSGTPPLRGAHYLKTKTPLEARKAVRMIAPAKQDAFPSGVRGIGGARPSDPCAVSVNVYARTILDLGLKFTTKQPPLVGRPLQLQASLSQPASGSVQIGYTVCRVVSPAHSLSTALADTKTIPLVQRRRFILKARGAPPRFDLVAYLAEYERRKPDAFPKQDLALTLKTDGNVIQGSLEETRFPGVYHVTLHIEGVYEPASHGDDCCKPPAQPFTRIVSTLLPLGLKPEADKSHCFAEWRSPTRLVVSVELSDEDGNQALPIFPVTVSLNGKSVQTRERGSTTVARQSEVHFFGTKLQPSKDGRQLSADAVLRTADGDKVTLKAGTPITLSAGAGGMDLPVGIVAFIGDARLMRAYPVGSRRAMRIPDHRRVRFAHQAEAEKAGYHIHEG
jgi:hypothetical protein